MYFFPHRLRLYAIKFYVNKMWNFRLLLREDALEVLLTDLHN